MQKGDYVLATKYSDGDPNDPWCIGYYAGSVFRDRYLVVDNNDKHFRTGGFIRCEPITTEEGSWLLKNIPPDPYHGEDVSIWGMLDQYRQQPPPLTTKGGEDE